MVRQIRTIFFYCSYNQKMATWDEAKRLRNIKVHGLDFVGGDAVFDGRFRRGTMTGWLTASCE